MKKNKFDKKIREIKTNENEYHLVDVSSNEEKLDNFEKISLKKQYSKNDKEVFTKDILVDSLPLPENVIVKKGTYTPKYVDIKKGKVFVDDELKYNKPRNLTNNNIFDNKFIGVDNKRTEKIAVLVHCYFIDVLIHTVLPKLLPLAKHADFYFNFIKNDDIINQSMAIEVIKSNFDNYTINYTDKNIGRDINGQFNNLSSIYKTKKSYDYYIMVHTKKSKHMVRTAAQNWLDDLLEDTVGNYDKINKILDSFKNDNSLGIIGSKTHTYETLKVMFTANKEKYEVLCNILGVDPDIKSYFIGGTFFWVRSEILDHYFKNNDNLKIIASKFSETGLLDGDWHHAMERVYGALCYSLNYTINGQTK